MTLILYTKEDHFFREGLRHFSSRFGIPPEEVLASPLIRFSHAASDDGSTPSVYGWIGLETVNVPLFEWPGRLEIRGEPVILFKGENEEFPVAWKDGNDLTIGFDLFRQVGICLSGVLDEMWRDAGPGKQPLVSIPFCDCYMDLIFRYLRAEFHKAGIVFISKTLWPSRQPYAVCLTHDVDEVRKTTQWFTYPLRSLIRRDFQALKNQSLSFVGLIGGREPFWTFEKIMALEDSLGVRSSWYFLQETSKAELLDRKTWRHLGRKYLFSDPAVTDLIGRMDAGGWEVGLHGSFSSYTNCDLLASELKSLEQVLGSRVIGCRQHNLNLQIPETWRCHQKAGIQYDTTLGFNDCAGFRWGTSIPFHPLASFEQNAGRFLEIPLVIQDLPLLRGKHVKDTYLKIASCVRQYGGVLTLLWHHPVFNDHEFPGWGEVYAEIIRFCTQEGAWITSGRDICSWWRRRENASFHQDLQGNTLILSPESDCTGILLDISFPQSQTPGDIQNGRIILQTGDCYTIQYIPKKDGEPLCIQVTTAEPPS